MFVYALVLLPVCLISILASQLPIKQQRQIVYGLVFVLTAFAALRGYVGTDTSAYHSMFEDYASESIVDLVRIVEPVFAILLVITGWFSDSSFAFVFSISILQGIILFFILGRCESPAMFLAIYTSTFFVNFHFNILRGGVAALLLLVAIHYLISGTQKKFYLAGTMSILSHYSSLLFFLPMTVVDRSWKAGLLVLLLSTTIAFGLVYYFVNDARLLQYINYSLLFDSDEGVRYGSGLIALFILYAILYYFTVSRENFSVLTLLLLTWYVIRFLSNYILFIDRLEVVINLIFLYLVTQHKPTGRTRIFWTLALSMLVLLNSYGALIGLEKADQSSRGAFDPDSSRRNSTYLPYKFIWEE